jgi:hypothetical protein
VPYYPALLVPLGGSVSRDCSSSRKVAAEVPRTLCPRTSEKLLYSITYPLLLFDGPGNDSSPRASRMRCHRPCLTHSSWRR